MNLEKIDRARIRSLLLTGSSFREIGRVMGVAHTSVSRIARLEMPGVLAESCSARNTERGKRIKIAGKRTSETKSSPLRRSAEGCVACLSACGLGRRKIDKHMMLPPGMAGNIIKKQGGGGVCRTREYYRMTEVYTKNKIEDRLRRNLRNRVRDGLKGRTKSAPTQDMIGCSFAELRMMLERMFTNEMSWKNYGQKWHLDHVVQLERFDLSDPEQVKSCFHYTNLRPLRADLNLSDGHRAHRSHQPLLPI